MRKLKFAKNVHKINLFLKKVFAIHALKEHFIKKAMKFVFLVEIYNIGVKVQRNVYLVEKISITIKMINDVKNVL